MEGGEATSLKLCHSSAKNEQTEYMQLPIYVYVYLNNLPRRRGSSFVFLSRGRFSEKMGLFLEKYFQGTEPAAIKVKRSESFESAIFECVTSYDLFLFFFFFYLFRIFEGIPIVVFHKKNFTNHHHHHHHLSLCACMRACVCVYHQHREKSIRYAKQRTASN